MAFLTPEHADALDISRMIFHVVGPKDSDLVLMEEIDPRNHRAFFLERVKSTLSGNLFHFNGASVVRDSLAAIAADPVEFVPKSKALAQAFHIGHAGNTSRGVFLLLALKAGDESLWSLIKYDHETVLAYVKREANGVILPDLSELQDTFVQSREALQKSAIVRLNGNGGDICVRDRSKPSDISNYFRAFLGADRKHTPGDLTLKVISAARMAAERNKAELGVEAMKAFNRNLYQTVQNQDAFDPENPEPFISGLFGALPQEAKFRTDFAKELERQRIHTENFDFDKAVVPRPSKRRIMTEEGIQVVFNAEDAGKVVRGRANGQEIITITTNRITVDDDYPETVGGRRGAAG